MSLQLAAHLCGWPGDVVQDHRRVMEIVSEAGYDGVEGFNAENAEELRELGALAGEHGLHLVNVGSSDPLLKAKINATLGNDAAEVPAARKTNYQDPTDAELEELAQPLESHIATFTKYGVKPFHHIHVGCLLETTEDCERVLERLPGLWLLYDTGHLLAANSDPRDVLRRWPNLIGHVHLKNFWAEDPQGGWDRRKPDFW
ncbi:MAG: hypothetical protein COZ06_10515 [Armatimonadetes bacterium CG_4_10_14_3_um_filter_66_18]|nr:MAG: hypothetical protein COZ57_33735 [Armatimonadetes bacterium CG_4_8_14_3_um_filter_66_20]PIY50201.1 MAG: hypothetical protein COZ06_10515 [Armatimonadetes bacterium CG_4_10_14_3_um_filter_66_18]PIZ34943.1 MAG: hypothetical protein COY42_27670 [Armatimonadetes bacterium CG_4_10_14_0_8_um_filter_66_14]PJB74467.1 MAG: hypothetical protein CO096_03515 [Armatimonadetes bacterium CG_4_9_14_3_um_filter_66_14]